MALANMVLPGGTSGVQFRCASGNVYKPDAAGIVTPLSNADKNELTIFGFLSVLDQTLANVVGPASATDGHLTAFDGATGKLLKDSAITEASVATAVTKAGAAIPGPGTVTDAHVVAFSGTTGQVVADSGLAVASLSTAITKAANATPTAHTPTKTSAGVTGTFQFDETYLYFVQASGNVFRFIPDPTFT